MSGVSVITPCHSYARYLRRYVESVLSSPERSSACS
jgi:hypothetical protein